MWLFKTKSTTTIIKINNNQLGLPDYIVKRIIKWLQHSIPPCSNDSEEDESTTTTTTDMNRNAYTLYDDRMSVQANILYLSLVCSYWFKNIIPSSMDRYTYILPSVAIQQQDNIKIFGRNVIARYKRSPLQQLQSIITTIFKR
ncbi:hypothetical protein DFA_10762 [Cavenderia fasciculata]|uniref:Uncharacterized protein n=1 Tax=Cavenderia fasciculata TaxID=261658 RepID=F4QBB7_CACFS|nr:uncharacterized protein DFA_10762 [Cavenderia fasciculata]EGG14889.1 hypothetical protein DFA_10762 [Cavenderia fasciculata]|eukprot:XP_004351405.1 hypothetical protein DFA_10762 [Cavenderia fasciculata]